jgi:hypothetical protein
MEGTIIFNDAASLAAFLKAFAGSTATFEVTENGNGTFHLTFNGGI